MKRAGYPAAERVTDLSIAGMSCASCVGRIERALMSVPGVLAAEVNLATERARALADVSDAALAGAVKQAGYEVNQSQAAVVGQFKQRLWLCACHWPPFTSRTGQTDPLPVLLVRLVTAVAARRLDVGEGRKGRGSESADFGLHRRAKNRRPVRAGFR